jgi:pimeloyl-ACP methyl ester carboxylesterase/exopolysaccharide biosynthesis protein
MKSIRVAIITVFLCFQFAFFLGVAHGQSSLQTVLDARKPNFSEPQYVKRHDEPKAQTLVLFVHGIFGDTIGTWKGASGLTLAAAVLQRAEFATGYDAYAFGFPSAMVKQGSFTVTQASAALYRTWNFEDFKRYKDVVLVAHSMGGLVAMEALTTYPDMRAKVRMLVTYATPYNGSQISSIARKVIQNESLADMFPADSTNGFISSLRARWKQNRISDKAPVIVKCAYETVPFPAVGVIVQKTSSDALCDGEADPIAEDHIGITKPGSATHDSVKVLVNALRALKVRQSAQNNSPTTDARGILVEDIDTAALSPDATYVANKVHRNLAELLGDAGQRVIAPPTSVATTGLTYAHKFSLRFYSVGDHLTIEVQFKDGDGVHLDSTEIAGRVTELREVYKAIPAALMYGLDLDETSLKKKNTSRRPTTNNLTYAHYLFSWRQLERGDKEAAERSLLRSVQVDTRFAMGYWALAELKRRTGASAEANAYVQRARGIDPDHRQMTAASSAFQDNPIGAVKSSIRSSPWQRLDSGLLYLHARNSAYAIEVRAWKFDTKELNVAVVEQKAALGSSAVDYLVANGDVLAIGGGFFNKDQDNRLSPAGILVTGGVVRNSLSSGQSGALVIDRHRNVDIVWARDLGALSNYLHVVQSGPILVEDDGRMGIRKDDFDRLNRTAVCLASNGTVFVDVRGQHNKGLSLYQLASVLLARPEDGGLGCRQALNLDGGPSTQAAYREGSKLNYIPGLWKGQNALVVSRP